MRQKWCEADFSMSAVKLTEQWSPTVKERKSKGRPVTKESKMNKFLTYLSVYLCVSVMPSLPHCLQGQVPAPHLAQLETVRCHPSSDTQTLSNSFTALKGRKLANYFFENPLLWLPSLCQRSCQLSSLCVCVCDCVCAHYLTCERRELYFMYYQLL